MEAACEGAHSVHSKRLLGTCHVSSMLCTFLSRCPVLHLCRALEGDEVAVQLLPVSGWFKNYSKFPPGVDPNRLSIAVRARAPALLARQ